MPNEELFSGIPALGDEQGLETYMNNSALEGMGLGDDNVPAALQTQQTEPQAQEPAPQSNAPQYTAEQVAQIVAQNQQALQQNAQYRAILAQQQQQQQRNPGYTPRQAEIIKQLIDRGVPVERIQQALSGQQASSAAQNALAQRLANMEAYLQQQQYLTAQNAFIDKMTTFGDKFGLTENDLVTFGNKAMSMGINLTTVSDVEAVFRAVYPDQYAIRSQRLAGVSSTPIYGGSSTPEAPRAMASKMEDTYVEQFLRHTMPNQYGMQTK